MKIHYEHRGSGPDLVMLHGWGLHGGIWGPFADELAHHFRVSMVDLPGHGYSDIPDRLAVDSMAQAIAAQVETSPGAIVLGWSLGAMVALELVRSYTERYAGLVWIAGTPSFVARDNWSAGMDPATLTGFADGLSQDYRSTLKRFISLNAGQDGDRMWLKQMQRLVFERGEPHQQVLEQGLAILQQEDMRERLAKASQSLLLVQGTHDRLVHPDTVPAIRAIHAAETLLVEGAGHAPFLAHADQVAQAIREFAP